MNPLTGFDMETKQLFNIIQKQGPISRSDLLHLLTTNIGTLTRMMAPLREARLITEVGIGVSTGGRKPVLYDVDRHSYFVLGIDISRPYTRVVIVNLKMEVVAKQQFVMDQNCTPDKTVKRIAEQFQALLQKMNLAKSKFLGAGLGTVGPLTAPPGVIMHPKNFIAPGWSNVPIQELLEATLELPLLVENGVNTAVLAESLFGEGRNYRNIAFLNCSGGVRMGAVSRGSLIRTINNDEDAFGHMVIDVDGEPCHCGNFGCIECYASIFAIKRAFRSQLKMGRASAVKTPLDAITIAQICAAAEANDDLAKAVLTNAATYLGVGLANYINLFDPNLVILSGPLVRNSPLFYKTTMDVALKKLYIGEKVSIVFSNGGHFGADAISVGAAVMLVENLLH